MSEGPDEPGHGAAASLVFAGIVIYVASFALGLGNVPSMQSELYPLAGRSVGTALRRL